MRSVLFMLFLPTILTNSSLLESSRNLVKIDYFVEIQHFYSKFGKIRLNAK